MEKIALGPDHIMRRSKKRPENHANLNNHLNESDERDNKNYELASLYDGRANDLAEKRVLIPGAEVDAAIEKELRAKEIALEVAKMEGALKGARRKLGEEEAAAPTVETFVMELRLFGYALDEAYAGVGACGMLQEVR